MIDCIQDNWESYILNSFQTKQGERMVRSRSYTSEAKLFQCWPSPFHGKTHLLSHKKQGQTVGIYLEEAKDHQGPQSMPWLFWQLSIRRLCMPVVLHQTWRTLPLGRDPGISMLTWMCTTRQTLCFMGPHTQQIKTETIRLITDVKIATIKLLDPCVVIPFLSII